ncbi:sensory box histidine kinase/response regulator [Ruegeria lacuscaerulensis ITI-1157]|nr:sensory box histidine kinase/response regulator [Ruegeria lacuscaerulensis ITI-1157]SHJ71817.1 PAS domain S-box-containing protein [Ruegeria lacuscaerulensis ITI-1157]
MSDTDTHVLRRRWVFGLIGFGVLLGLVAVAWLSAQVFTDFNDRRAAPSDNVQWTLSQVEVDYLSYLNALETASAAQDAENGTLDLVRRRFDLFYSRVDTLAQSRVFQPLRQDDRFRLPLERVTRHLNAAIPLIDAPDAELSEQLDDLKRAALEIGPHVRTLAVSGISYFATESDQQRIQTAANLLRLAILSGALLLTLGAVSAYLLVVNRRATRRGRALRQANERMNTILSTSLDGVIVVDAKGDVIEFNPAAEAIFGYTADKARGRAIGDLIVPPHLRAAHRAGMERMQAGGDLHVVGKGRVQLEAMRADGEQFPVELALQSARAGDQEIIIGFVRDISQRVAAQQELISTRDQALAGEKAKAEFLTVMSHEIRTPLNGLLGNLTLLKNTRTTREQARFVENMEISGQILLSHVDSVLDIARFEAGKLSVALQPTDLNDILQEIVDGQSGNAASRGNSISWQWVGEARPCVAADAQRLRQILLNLVGNAIKFTENGRISIEVEVTEPGPTAGVNIFEFRIIDTGIGIGPDEVDVIFDDFHTSDPSTGLGLGIARRFARAMGGEIGVESTPEEGSVFWVRLPLQDAELDANVDSDQSDVQHAQPLDVLVVEDNEINREVICNMLKLDGHRVTVAENGQLGVDAAAAHRFDVILMDISMPVMDGPTATRHIRSGGGPSADIPIIAVSANVLPDAVDAFRAAGMTAFVGKPIALDALRKALRAVTEPDALIQPEDETDHIGDLRASLGADVFDRLLGKYLSEGDAVVAQLAGLDGGEADLDQVAQECHKLAGSAATFGAMGFRDALIAIEMAAKSADREQVAHLLRSLPEEWERAKAALPAPGAVKG